MTIAFAAEVVADTENLVESVFSHPVVLRNETNGDAKIPAGRIGLIANYRGYVTSGRGKKARGAGEAVLDLSAVSRIPASELSALIAHLEDLQGTLDEGVAAASALATT